MIRRYGSIITILTLSAAFNLFGAIKNVIIETPTSNG